MPRTSTASTSTCRRPSTTPQRRGRLAERAPAPTGHSEAAVGADPRPSSSGGSHARSAAPDASTTRLRSRATSVAGLAGSTTTSAAVTSRTSNGVRPSTATLRRASARPTEGGPTRLPDCAGAPHGASSVQRVQSTHSAQRVRPVLPTRTAAPSAGSTDERDRRRAHRRRPDAHPGHVQLDAVAAGLHGEPPTVDLACRAGAAPRRRRPPTPRRRSPSSAPRESAHRRRGAAGHAPLEGGHERGRSSTAGMMRWTEPTSRARSTVCTASNSAATSPSFSIRTARGDLDQAGPRGGPLVLRRRPRARPRPPAPGGRRGCDRRRRR